jgi:hypothetical protein
MLVRLLLVLLALSPTPAFAGQAAVRTPIDPEELSLQAFLQAVETSISTMDRARWTELLSATADRDAAAEFFDAMVPQGITRVVVKERDRSALQGALPGEGYRLVVEVFIETGPRGRIATWRLDIRRPRGDDIGRQPWRILSQDRLASIEGLHNLALHREKQYAARNLVLRSVDLELRLPAGDVFVAETPEGVTALVLLGEGTMVFQPAPKEERGQLKLFAGTETLETPFTSAFVRINPFEFEQRVTSEMLAPAAFDGRVYRRGLEVFDDGLPKSFNLDLSDLSRDTWSLLPQFGDFVAEVNTRRFDILTYARSSNEAEDVSMFQRARKRNISAYASELKLQSRGRFFNEDDLVDYDVLDYQIDASFYPEREWMEGRTRMSLRPKQSIAVLTLRFADSLNVSSVISDEFGRLLFLRVRNQNSLLVNLPSPVARDFPLNLTITYSGRLERQRTQEESIAAGQRNAQPDDIPFVPSEPKWLFSNRNYWYPQNQVTDYATARVQITVPYEYHVVSSGILDPFSPAAAASAPVENSSRVVPRVSYSFTTPQPVRYLSFLVSRMSRIDAATVALDIDVKAPSAPDMQGAHTLQEQISRLNRMVTTSPPVGGRNTIQLAVDANRRQEARSRDAITTAAEILRLYAGLLGDAPYGALTLAMVEDELPGGHAPGYYAMINNPPPVTPFNWRNDPAAFQGFPEFFLAHELAHQWFGQAVGWKNYHEQWLSEGFSQYLAALFAKERRGEQAFRDVLRQFRRWSLEESDQGPVFLGYRLGHIKGESRVFRALVYNKGAGVLHMLRRVVGDEPFFAGLRQFYADNRFKKAGTDDLRKAMEAASKRDLSRFFERWIYDNAIPRLRFSSTVEDNELIVRFEQTGEIFDVPVTVGVTYADGKTAEFLVIADQATTEARFPLTGPVRSVEPNVDDASLAHFERR